MAIQVKIEGQKKVVYIQISGEDVPAGKGSIKFVEQIVDPNGKLLSPATTNTTVQISELPEGSVNFAKIIEFWESKQTESSRLEDKWLD